MATAVFFHAHPDDEAIATGGTMAKAKREGHRVVLLVATNGEEGEPQPGVLGPGESLGARRRAEVERAAALLGVDRLVLLGYRDSGMMGTDANRHRDAFWQVDVEAAARRTSRVLLDERAEVFVVYDDNGVYGHPDHIQVHRVGVRAAELAGTPSVFECSPNRDLMVELFAEFAARGAEGVDGDDDLPDTETFGLPESELTHRVDVGDFLALKRQALLEHASQVSPDHPMMQMPEHLYRAFMGVEWYRERGRPRLGTDFRFDLFR